MHKDNKGYNLNIQGNKLVWNLPGDKILSNLAGVFQVLIDLEFDISLLVSGIHNYRPEGNRLKIESTDRYRVINDTYNANPESMESSISITKQLSDGKDFLCILGDMKELGDYSEYYHKKIGNFLANLGCKMLITYGKDSRFILEEFLNEKNDLEERRGIHFPEGDLDGAVTWIVNNAPKNCTILCKGSRSMKMETIVEKILAIPPII
jgi:UDP-N-acetylmuramoyl-tripeptide--D-alanyl-D-alanine ligase